MRVRRKPIEVEAVHIDPKAEYPFAEAMAFTKELGDSRTVHLELGKPVWLALETPEGIMLAKEGDWIIEGAKGKFYPCKPDTFEQTYEVIE